MLMRQMRLSANVFIGTTKLAEVQSTREVLSVADGRVKLSLDQVGQTLSSFVARRSAGLRVLHLTVGRNGPMVKARPPRGIVRLLNATPRRLLLGLSALIVAPTTSLCQSSPPPVAPPPAPTRIVIDEYYGNRIEDPYRYMEDLQSPEVQ